MAITDISRDWGVSPSIVRITSTDNLAAITTVGYVFAQAANIQAINNGDFEFSTGDEILIVYSGGQSFFTYNPATGSFVEAADPGYLPSALPAGYIFVGNAEGIATGVAMTGDIDIDDEGTTVIVDNTITKAMLTAAITPSHIVKYGAIYTTAGGAAAEVIAIPGVLGTDLAFVQLQAPGTNSVSVTYAVATADTLTVTFSGDPGDDAIIYYQILRATS